MAHDPVQRILETLREYLYRHYPERRNAQPFPLAFWTIDDDDLFFEALGYLPLHMGVTDSGEVPHLDEMPEGFRLAFPIFWLEDDYAFNGWTALTNAGTWLLPSTIAAYERIGLPTEAQALRAALRACEQDPHDSDAAEAAYKTVTNPFADEERRSDALLAFFRANACLFEPTLPA